MLIKELRITMPLTVEEYQIGQLFSVAEASKNQTGGGEGVEVVKNEPFENYDLLGGEFTKGQYTYKIYHLASRVPNFIKIMIPKSMLEIHEEAWNAYPYCRTVLTNPFMKDDFFLRIETMHYPDDGQQPNIHKLPPEKLNKREVIFLDIANDPVSSKDYVSTEDPKLFKSEKTGRGLLGKDWIETSKPIMTCYKLVTCEFKWFGCQNRVENYIQTVERRILLNLHRQIFCWIDRWYGFTIEDIRRIEEETKIELNNLRVNKELRGTLSDD